MCSAAVDAEFLPRQTQAKGLLLGGELQNPVAEQGQTRFQITFKQLQVQPLLAPGEADAFIAECRSRHGLTISGVMCIPPVDEPPAPHFALAAKIAARNGLSLLSMGMSADFAAAIRFGATHVRVGSAIFGSRAVGE